MTSRDKLPDVDLETGGNRTELLETRFALTMLPLGDA